MTMDTESGSFRTLSPSENDRTKFDEPQYRCALCENCFANKQLFVDHLGPHCIRLDDVDTPRSREKRVSTVGTTPAVRPFKCERCELVFDRVSQLDNHRRSVHRQERSQVCQICGKGFFRHTDLKTHLNIHLGTNRCMCEICGRKFNHVSNLIRHGRTHSGVKPYPCTICGKRFTQINTLERHKAIHKRGDQTLGCSFCNKVYKSENGLKEHMKKLHGFTEKLTFENNKQIMKRRHYCKICGESFQFVELLRDHERTHQNDKMLECKSCDQKFEKTDEIKEHRCGRQLKLLLDPGGILSKKEDSRKDYHPRKDFTRHKSLELDYKLSQGVINGSNEFTEDKQTKKTIVYVTAEQLANMNTEQVVDRANPFLHEHVMKLAVEDDNRSRACDEETVVSEMINSCWKEIEIPDVNESHISEKRISALRNNSQNIIHVLASSETENPSDSNTRKNFTPKICDDRHKKRENENLSIKLCQDKMKPQKLLDIPSNTSRNIRGRNCTSDARTARAFRSVIPKDYFGEGNSGNSQDLLVEGTVNSSITDSDHGSGAESAIGKLATEPTLRLVQTESGEEFYELQITNCPDKSENSYESARISIDTVLESLRPRQRNESIPESLLKVVHLENGQRVLEIMKNTSGVEDAVKDSKCASKSSSCSSLSNKNIGEYSSKVEENFLENKNDKIIYFAQNSKDNLMDFFEFESLGTQEVANSFNLSEEVMQNVPQTNFDTLTTLNRNGKDIEDCDPPIDKESCQDLLGLINNNDPSKAIEKMRKREEAPMVRLVQNEDGAQFFELIRGDLEFEDPIELVERAEFDPEDPLQLGNGKCTILNPNQGESGSMIKSESDLPRAKKHYKNKEKKYNCDVCKKSFSKGYNYRQHIGTHFADQQKFKCKECGQLFAWKSTLNKHVATHRAGGQQKFVCEICPKVYTTLSQVNEHVKRDHLKERNNKCTECGKTFFKKFDLKIHIRTHTKERPYECRVCYKSFHHQSHIIRHERIHSGERPYACNICEKTFTQLGSLKNHRQRHQELKIDILDYQMDEDEPLPHTTL